MKRALPLCLLLLLACETSKPPAPVKEAAAPRALAPWSWHALGGVIVIEGEVDRPTDLSLDGRYIHSSFHTEIGPVRWELFRPPEGEHLVMKDESGKVLARWTLKGDGSESEAPKPQPRPAAAPKLVAKARPLPATKPTPTPKPPPAPPAPKLAKASPPPPPARSASPAPAPRIARLMNPPAPEPRPAVAADGAAFPGAGEGLNLTQGPRDEKVILLSFDGGSSSEAATEVLDALKAHGIRTTIFLTGAFIEKYPDLVRRMVAEGHEIGNHTFDHPHFAPGMRRDPAWTKERVQSELLRADAAFYRLTGRPMDPFWRSPYGENTPEIRRWAEELGYRHVGWSEGADSLDWATAKERRLYRTGAAILEHLHQRLDKHGEGLIVLMHLGSERPEGDRPAEKLGQFMDRALGEGWRFVSAGEMLREMGRPAWRREGRLALLQGRSTAGNP